MALWPFSKKNSEQPADEAVKDSAAQGAPESAADEVQAPVMGDFDSPDPVHDAVDGEKGPFDADTVSIDDFDFSDFSAGILDLGSLQIPLPMRSEVQVEMGPEGPRLLHIITEHGRITPVGFAAPRSAGQWREACRDIAEGMRNDGLDVSVERGPWGREIVGRAGDAVIRMIGVDGPRWMLRFTLAGPADRSEDMAVLGREVAARTFVTRGKEPLMAGTSLPITLPEALANQVRNAMENKEQWLPELERMERQRAEEAAAASAEAGQPAQPQQPVSPASALGQMKAEDK